MTLTSMTGSPVFYPKLAELETGSVIFEKAKLVKSEPGRKFKNQTNWIFEVPETIKTEKGEFNKVGVSAGMITAALKDEPMGGFYKMVYLGKNTIEKGEWKGSKAHTFEVLKYGEAPTVEPTVDTKAAAASRVSESKSNTTSDSLDDMMN